MSTLEPIKEAEVVEPKQKSIEELTSEYHAACKEVGNIQYQMDLFQEQLKELYSRMRLINQQGAELKAKQEGK